MRKRYLTLGKFRIQVQEAVQLGGVLLILGLMQTYHNRHQSVRPASVLVAQAGVAR